MSNKSLVRLRIVLYSSWALFNAWCTSMAGVNWDTMGWEAQSVLIGGILLNWTAVLMAFFDKSAWRLDQETKNDEKIKLTGTV
jgi:hypothetical protein